MVGPIGVHLLWLQLIFSPQNCLSMMLHSVHALWGKNGSCRNSQENLCGSSCLRLWGHNPDHFGAKWMQGGWVSGSQPLLLSKVPAYLMVPIADATPCCIDAPSLQLADWSIRLSLWLCFNGSQSCFFKLLKTGLICFPLLNSETWQSGVVKRMPFLKTKQNNPAEKFGISLVFWYQMEACQRILHKGCLVQVCIWHP